MTKPELTDALLGLGLLLVALPLIGIVLVALWKIWSMSYWLGAATTSLVIGALLIWAGTRE